MREGRPQLDGFFATGVFIPKQPKRTYSLPLARAGTPGVKGLVIFVSLIIAAGLSLAPTIWGLVRLTD